MKNTNILTVILALLSTSLILTSAQAQRKPIKGHVDRVEKGNIVKGWSCVPGYPKPIKVHVYIGGPAGGGGEMVASAMANINSEDAVRRACGVSSGAYRFKIQLPEIQQEEKVFVHGIHPRFPEFSNDLLRNSGRFVARPNPRNVSSQESPSSSYRTVCVGPTNSPVSCEELTRTVSVEVDSNDREERAQSSNTTDDELCIGPTNSPVPCDELNQARGTRRRTDQTSNDREERAQSSNTRDDELCIGPTNSPVPCGESARERMAGMKGPSESREKVSTAQNTMSPEEVRNFAKDCLSQETLSGECLNSPEKLEAGVELILSEIVQSSSGEAALEALKQSDVQDESQKAADVVREDAAVAAEETERAMASLEDSKLYYLDWEIEELLEKGEIEVYDRKYKRNVESFFKAVGYYNRDFLINGDEYSCLRSRVRYPGSELTIRYMCLRPEYSINKYTVKNVLELGSIKERPIGRYLEHDQSLGTSNVRKFKGNLGETYRLVTLKSNQSTTNLTLSLGERPESFYPKQLGLGNIKPEKENLCRLGVRLFSYKQELYIYEFQICRGEGGKFAVSYRTRAKGESFGSWIDAVAISGEVTGNGAPSDGGISQGGSCNEGDFCVTDTNGSGTKKCGDNGELLACVPRN